MKPRVLLGSLALFSLGAGYALRPEPVEVTLQDRRDPGTVFWRSGLASPRVRDFHYFRAALMNHYQYPPLPFPERVPYRVSLQMRLVVEEPGSYRFELDSPWFGALEIDGERVFGSGPLFPGEEAHGTITLRPGIYQVLLLLQPSDAPTGGVRLLWQPPGERLRDVDPGDLLDPSRPRLHRLGSWLSAPLLWAGGLILGVLALAWVSAGEATRQNKVLACLFLSFLSLATRSAHLAYYPRLGGDELHNAWAGWNLLHEGRPKSWSRLPIYPEGETVTWFGRTFPIVSDAFDHPPLLEVVLGAASTLGGAENMYQNTPGRIRPPMVVFGSLGVVLLFLIAARLFDFPTAFLAGALMALSPLAVFSSRLAKEEGLVQLLWLAGLYIYLLIRNRKQTPAWDCLLGAVLGLATLSKVTGLALGVAFGATALADGRNFRRAARMISVALAVSAFYPLYGYLLNARLFNDVMSYMGGRFSVEDISDKLFIIPRFILEPKLGAGTPFVDGWILLGWLSLPFLISKRFVSIPFVSYLLILALTIHSQNEYGFYLIPIYPLLFLAAAQAIRHVFLRPAVLPTFLFITLFFLLPMAGSTDMLLFGFRTVMSAAYLPLLLVVLGDVGWKLAEPIRLVMVQGMVVLSFLFAIRQCFAVL